MVDLQPTVSLRILIVEDNITDLKLAHSVLARAGHDVSDATSAEQAVELIEKNVPQVILTDLKLPHMDGFSLSQHLKHSSRTSAIPVIAMSSFAADFPRRRVRDAGFAAYLVKPLNTRTLCHQVTEALKPA